MISKIVRLSCLACLFLHATTACFGAQESAVQATEFADTLAELVPRLLNENMVPGAAVALIENGRVVINKGYGSADVARNKPVTPQTGFNIGSISKTVAAWGVMHLVDEGKLKLDEPVSTYLTRWQLPESEFDASGVTVRRLLSHTAGLSLHGYPGFGPDDRLPSAEASLAGETNGSGDVRLIMEPGTKWKYSGGGYTILQLLVEEVSGQSFADFMRINVLKPLGMNHSDYHLSPQILANSALAYDGWGEPTPNPRFTAQAAAGLHTTITDLATFAAAALIDNQGNLPGRSVLKTATVATMLTPAPAASGRYGLGYGIQQLPDGSTAVGHGGANRGWHAYVQVVPQTGAGIAIVTNGSNGYNVHGQVYYQWMKWLTGKQPERAWRTPIAIALKAALQERGVNAAIEQYRSLKENRPDDFVFAENQLNRLGYELLGKKRNADAIEIFKLNVETFPNAANPYDSLGEAYMTNGNKELAVQNYKKSLELDPSNSNAEQMLQKLAGT